MHNAAYEGNFVCSLLFFLVKRLSVCSTRILVVGVCSIRIVVIGVCSIKISFTRMPQSGC